MIRPPASTAAARRERPAVERCTVGGVRSCRLALGVIAVAVALHSSGCRQPPAPVGVVLVVVDALRADHLGHYGYRRATSPGLDDFAGHATRFTDCQASASWTNPSVASLFTGLDTPRHATNAFGAALPEQSVTLAELARSAGWATAAISFNPGIRSELDFDQGFDEFDEFLGKSTHYPDIADMVARVGSWLERRDGRPFLLYLHPMNVHGPYRVPDEHRTVLLGRPPSREFRYYAGSMRRILRGGDLEARAMVPPSYLESLVDSYDTAVRYSTDQIGRLFQALERAGVYRDSLVIVTSDHGEELFDHGGFSHGYTLHRELLHVPLYVKLPRQAEPRVVDAPVSLVDLLPTVLDVLGIGIPDGLDGRSLRRLAEGRGDPRFGDPRTRLAQVSRPGRCQARAITDGEYKLIHIDANYEGLRDVVRLYDVAADVLETNDLADARPEVAARMLGALEAAFAAAEGRALDAAENRLGDLDRDRLRALGYLDDGDDGDDRVTNQRSR